MSGVRVDLVASSDDYLLEVGVQAAVERMVEHLDGADVLEQPDGITANDLALEVRSPSLFASRRVLVVADAQRWLEAPAPEGRSAPGREDPGLLVQLLAEGVPQDVGLVLSGLVGRRPKGPLAAAIEASGALTWVPPPEPPKPWEDATISAEQRRVLRSVVTRSAPSAKLTADAERLLYELVGFAPRRLAQESLKLASAADGDIDAELVRSLVAPQTRSLDVVLDALETGNVSPVLDLVSGASSGRTVTDWSGARLEGRSFYSVLVGTLGGQLEQMAYLRFLTRDAGLSREMDPSRCQEGRWYSQHFKQRIGPALVERIEYDSPNPFVRADRRKRKISLWYLHRLFRAATHFSDEVLCDALIRLAGVERLVRGPMAAEAVTGWVSRLL